MMNNTIPTQEHWSQHGSNAKYPYFDELPLKDYLVCYQTLHKQSSLSSLSYDDYIIPVQKYLLPKLGHIQIKDLSSQLLRNCYRILLENPMVPISVITGMNRLLEVAFDYAIRQGAAVCNPAGILSSEYAQKMQRKLPYFRYPLIVTQFTADQLGYYPDEKIYYDVSAPYFPEICYLGTSSDDGISIVRRFLLDAIEVTEGSPLSHDTIRFIQSNLKANQKIVWVELNAR